MMSQQKNQSNIQAGVDRSYAKAIPQKVTFALLHFFSLALCAYLLLGGLEQIGSWLGKSWTVHNPTRSWLVFGVTALYFARHLVTLFYLLMRNVLWSEALQLSFFMLVFEVGFLFLSTGAISGKSTSLGWFDFLAVGLVLVGSFLNTGSEVLRKWWKNDPSNKGKCYTKGLFAYSMHINFFGDSVLFTGWALLTGVWWSLGIPAMMTALFIFMHIPGLDRYLEEHYGDDFIAYSKRTKKFIPFIY